MIFQLRFFMSSPFTSERMPSLFSIIIVLLCWASTIVTPNLVNSQPLPKVIRHSRFISYTPRSFSLVGGQVTPATEIGIRKDLTLLRPFFDGIITYSSDKGIEITPKIANELGYQAMIMGIWDPNSESEITNLLAAVKQYPTLIAAVIVGNEGLYSRRYQEEDVKKAIRRIHQECPALPTTTSEPFFLYFKPELSPFFHSHDLVMPNIHPVFEKWFAPNSPTQGVEMVLQVAKQFKQTYPQPLLIKETGMPSGQTDHGFSASRQALFWAELFRRFPTSDQQSFSCFEAFDGPWKPAEMSNNSPGDHGNEAFWGFFTVTGQSKSVVDALPRLVVGTPSPLSP